jgi:hypothetical protein
MLQQKVKSQFSEILKLTLTIKKKDIRIKQLEEQTEQITKERDQYKKKREEEGQKATGSRVASRAGSKVPPARRTPLAPAPAARPTA